MDAPSSKRARSTEEDRSSESDARSTPAFPLPAVVPRACDYCRARKAKCTREQPKCRLCKTSGVLCTFSEAPKKQNPAVKTANQMETVLERLTKLEEKAASQREEIRRISSHVSMISENVSAILQILKGSPVTSSPVDLGAEQSLSEYDHQSSGASTPSASPAAGPEILSSNYALGSEAQNLTELAIRETSSAPGGIPSSTDQAIDEEAQGLKELIKKLEPAGWGGVIVDESSNSLYLPSSREIDLIFNGLKRIEMLGIPLFTLPASIEELTEILRNPKPWRDPAYLIVIYCCSGATLGHDDPYGPNHADETRLKKSLYNNGWKIFKGSSFMLVPEVCNVQALLLLSIAARESSRAGVCWLLLSYCCRLAIALGLNRKVKETSGLSRQDIEKRKSLFWSLFALDQTLSLTYGRTPCFAEYDCDVEYPTFPTVLKAGNNPVMEMMLYFTKHYFHSMVEMSKLQGRTYARLYSASSAGKTPDQLEKIVWELDAEMREWEKVFKETIEDTEWPLPIDSPEIAAPCGDVRLGIQNMRFSFLNQLLLIHRRNGNAMTVPTETPSRKICIESARASIQLLVDLGERDRDHLKLKMFMLYHPFTPFFILFSKIFSDPQSPSNTSDLELMQLVVYFLERVKGDDEDLANILAVAKGFSRIASAFLERNKNREMPLLSPPPPSAESFWPISQGTGEAPLQYFMRWNPDPTLLNGVGAEGGTEGQMGQEYVDVFQSAVRQGAMEMDWINWDPDGSGGYQLQF